MRLQNHDKHFIIIYDLKIFLLFFNFLPKNLPLPFPFRNLSKVLLENQMFLINFQVNFAINDHHLFIVFQFIVIHSEKFCENRFFKFTTIF